MLKKLSIKFATAALFFSTYLMTATATATANVSLIFGETYPTVILGNDKRSLSKASQNLETEALEEGIRAFMIVFDADSVSSDSSDDQSELIKAGKAFMVAIGDYGSPLAYLYLSVLIEEEETAARYHTIAFNAVKRGAVNPEIFFAHANKLKALGFYEND